MSYEFDRGRMDGVMGVEFKNPYRVAQKKEDYNRGYHQGSQERKEQETKEEIDNMNDDQKQQCRANIQRLKAMFQGNTNG